jgi:hypothetical protein
MLIKICLFVLVGTVSVVQAQKLEKTSLKIPNLQIPTTGFKGDHSVYGFGSDENNYYVYSSRTNSFFVINKKLTTIKEHPIKEEKDDRFLRIFTTENEVVVLVAQTKKNEQKTQIIKRTYAKSTGKLKNETTIAAFQKSRSESWYFYSKMSPDKTKTGYLFLIASKKSTVDSYYAAVLDEDAKLEWETINDLEISNETFTVQDLVVTNKGEMYVAFFSYPEKVKKAVDKNSYIDLMVLTDGTKDKMKIPIDEYIIVEVKLKPLKSGDVYLAALFAKDENSYKTEFFSMILNGKKLNDDKSHTKEIEEKNTHIRQPKYFPAGNYLYNLGIERILELDNGNIAVVCEQSTSAILIVDGVRFYCRARGSVNTFFVKGNDASIEDVSVMEKLQSIRYGGSFQPQWLGLSIFPFVYGDKVGYIFNDALKKRKFYES